MDDDMFDPTLMKKKKKAKKGPLPRELEVIIAGPEPDGDGQSSASALENGSSIPVALPTVIANEGESIGASAVEIGPGGIEKLATELEGLDLDLESFGKKKKKKKKDIEELVADIVTDELGNKENEDQVTEGASGGTTTGEWTASSDDRDRDYTYDELLDRIFGIMKQKNPEMIAGIKTKFVMRPPQVVRAGTKKTSFVNFMEICKMLHRPQKHVIEFLLTELGTVGSIDGSDQLIIKGRFQQKQIENILRRYIKEYVTCHTCRSPNTLLQKDSRLFFLQCEACGSRISVTNIKHGFQAVISKRAAIRAKAT